MLLPAMGERFLGSALQQELLQSTAKNTADDTTSTPANPAAATAHTAHTAHSTKGSACTSALACALHRCMLQRGCVLREQVLRLKHACGGGQWWGKNVNGKQHSTAQHTTAQHSTQQWEQGVDQERKDVSGKQQGMEQETSGEARDELLGACEAELRALVKQLLAAPSTGLVVGGVDSIGEAQVDDTDGTRACTGMFETLQGASRAGAAGECISHAAAAALSAIATLSPSHSSQHTLPSTITAHTAASPAHTVTRLSLPRPPSLMPLAWGGALRVLASWGAWAEPHLLAATLQLVLASSVKGRVMRSSQAGSLGSRCVCVCVSVCLCVLRVAFNVCVCVSHTH